MAKKRAQELIESSPREVASQELLTVMEEEAKKRELITLYISKHMSDGTDYGTIRIGGRDSKPSLFKPGSEKFLSLFKLTAKFTKDTETWEMAGSEPGVLCYICHLTDSKGNFVGEGRGAASLKEKQWTLNNCIKIAEKRAQIDAVLRTGALSDFFTQDLEDMKKEPEIQRPPKTYIQPSIQTQRAILFNKLRERGVDVTDGNACRIYVADETQLELNENNYGAIINTLK